MSRYSHLYTPLLELLAPSPVSRLMAGHRPDAIQLTGGDPDPDYFPRAEIKEITDYIMDREAATALQYGDPAGCRKLREQIVRIANTKRQNAQIENVMVISGSAESFDLMCKVFISPGDHVLIEEPSYSGAVTSFRAHGCTLVPVPVDDDGIIPEQAEKTLAQKKAEGVRVKFMYILPNYQNPTGATLPLERRRHLLAIAKEYGALILEDDAYIEFRYEGEELPTIKSLDTEGLVVYTTTFSKTFAPGTRLGWIVADPELIKGLTFAKSVTSLMASPLTQTIAAEFVRRGYLDRHIETSKAVCRTRRDAMLAALEKYMPAGVTWSRPRGGYFIWVTIPERRIDGTELLRGAVAAGVSYRPGSICCVTPGNGDNSLRLGFSTVNEAVMEEGVRRLAEVIKGLLA
jgi:2-aminoadipate transaminase